MANNDEYEKSDTLILGALLSLSGGFQDAYTYVLRGNVFANAQTGNVVLMSRYLMTGNWSEALQYIFPIVAFAIGILAAEQIGYRFRDSTKIHWRQIILIIEIIVLTAVAFIPHSFDMLANVMVSFSCAMQVQAFRTVKGPAISRTTFSPFFRKCWQARRTS